MKKSPIQETFYYVCDKRINITNIENIKFISNNLKYKLFLNLMNLLKKMVKCFYNIFYEYLKK